MNAINPNTKRITDRLADHDRRLALVEKDAVAVAEEIRGLREDVRELTRGLFTIFRHEIQPEPEKPARRETVLALAGGALAKWVGLVLIAIASVVGLAAARSCGLETNGVAVPGVSANP
jgi:hypothetical protein